MSAAIAFIILLIVIFLAFELSTPTRTSGFIQFCYILVSMVLSAGIVTVLRSVGLIP